MKIALGLLFMLAVNFCIAQTPQGTITSSPDSAVIVYKDIANFWKAFDRIGEEGNGVFEKYYINPGSNGVKHFLDHNRIVNADTLYNTVQRQRNDYLRIREQTLRAEEAVPQCRSTYYAFKYLYPQAKFPPLYFVIGRFNTGGVS